MKKYENLLCCLYFSLSLLMLQHSDIAIYATDNHNINAAVFLSAFCADAPAENA